MVFKLKVDGDDVDDAGVIVATFGFDSGWCKMKTSPEGGGGGRIDWNKCRGVCKSNLHANGGHQREKANERSEETQRRNRKKKKKKKKRGGGGIKRGSGGKKVSQPINNDFFTRHPLILRGGGWEEGYFPLISSVRSNLIAIKTLNRSCFLTTTFRPCCITAW